MRLPAGGFASAGVVEVLRLPAIDQTNGEWESSRLLGETSALLGEVYQSYQWAGDLIKLVSIELALCAVDAPDQPLSSEIQIFLVARAVGAQASVVASWAHRLTTLLSSAVGSMGYDYALASIDRYIDARAGVSPDAFLQLNRSAAMARLEIGDSSQVFDFDRLPPMPPDVGRLTSALAASPNSAVLFQLSPTVLTPEEARSVGQSAIQLRALSDGSVATGHVGIETARRIADTYSGLEAGKSGPLFEFNVAVQGSAEHAQSLAGRVYAQLYGDDPDTTLRTSLTDIRSELKMERLGILSEPWRLHDGSTDRMNAAIGGAHPLTRLPSIATATEASALFRLPVLDDRVGVGFEESHSTRIRRNYSAGVLDDYDVSVGVIRSPGHQIGIGLRLGDLNKHMFVTGTPGSGKTTFTLGLVQRLWSDHGIPSLIIEPTKMEYRVLKQVIPDLQVFTPGNSQLAPLPLNPFLPPDGVTLERHKSSLNTAFAAGVSMVPPLNHLFAEAVDLAYDRAGWFDRATAAESPAPISIWEVIEAFDQIVSAVGYTGDALNIGRAGLVRLRALRRFYDTYQSVSVESLLERPTVIELSALEHAEDKALCIALVLLNVMAHTQVRGDVEGASLRNLIVLEEAHVLLDARGQGANDESDPVGVARELIRRLLAEFRALGVGVVVADQSPRAVGDDVIALTNIKVGFRLVEAGDQDAFGSSVGMDEGQRGRQGRLRPGEASVFFDRLAEVEEIVTPDVRLAGALPVSIPDAELRAAGVPIVGDPYPECSLISWDGAWGDVARQIGRAVAQGLRIASSAPTSVDLQGGVREVVERSAAAYPESIDLAPMAVLCFLRFVRFDLKITIEPATVARTLRTVSELARRRHGVEP